MTHHHLRNIKTYYTYEKTGYYVHAITFGIL